MNLFISRKNQLNFPTLKDDERNALNTNFLEIERWANSQISAVAVTHSSTHSIAGSSGANPVPGPWTVLYDTFNLADTANNQLTVPDSGVYFVSATMTANNIALTTPGQLPQDALLGMVGGSSHIVPRVQAVTDWGVTYQSTGGGFNGGGAPQLAFTFPVLVTAPTNVHLQVTSNSTGMDYEILSFSLIRVGSIPSKVQ